MRRLFSLFAVTLVILIASLPGAITFASSGKPSVQASSCYDSIQNGKEEGIDCGGDCFSCTPFMNEPACGDSLDYQCGIKTVSTTDHAVESCTRTLDYGNCQSGYSCVDNLCISDSNKSCESIDCGTGQYCMAGVCLLEVPGSTYFVATWGSDSHAGTLENPFQSWQKAVDVMVPGDIAYLRGGVWQKTDYAHSGTSALGLMINEDAGHGRNGTSTAPIRYYNYPGEKPILDGRLAQPHNRWLHGLAVTNGEHIHFKGITIHHIYQDDPIPTHAKPYAQVAGVSTSGANLHFENMSVHDIDGRAFQHWSKSWSEIDAEIGYDYCVARQLREGKDPAECSVIDSLFLSDKTSWINCDAYNLFDWSGTQPGNHADGWKVETYSTGEFFWKGCRAWNFSDDGFDPHGYGKRVFEDCWAASGDNYINLTDPTDAEGNGFKTVGVYIQAFPDYQLGGEPNVIFKRTIAADNIGSGYLNNLYVDFDKQYPNNARYYNTLSYKNKYGYSDKSGSTFYNNIVYNSTGTGSNGVVTEISIAVDDYTESHNTWTKKNPGASWPLYNYNPEFSVTDEDFLSLDPAQLTRPRKTDWSLPDIDFAHFSSSSEMIDGGRIIENYHCPNAGRYPGLDCVEWYGAAPDLGPFEYMQRPGENTKWLTPAVLYPLLLK